MGEDSLAAPGILNGCRRRYARPRKTVASLAVEGKGGLKGPDRRDPGDVPSRQAPRIRLVDAAEREDGEGRGGRQRLEARAAQMLRPRMTSRRENGRQEREMRAETMRPDEIGGAVGGGGGNGKRSMGSGEWGIGRASRAIPHSPIPTPPTRPMHAVRADPRGERRIAGDEEQNAAPGADRLIAPRRRLAARIVIIAKDDGGALRQRAQDRLRVCDPPPVRHEGEAKGRVSARCGFQRPRRRC